MARQEPRPPESDCWNGRTSHSSMFRHSRKAKALNSYYLWRFTIATQVAKEPSHALPRTDPGISCKKRARDYARCGTTVMMKRELFSKVPRGSDEQNAVFAAKRGPVAA